ncbi:unnamed protein product [Cunninghamella echinulata]
MSIKKTPCNECRERKRRCSYELPSCERKTPADEEYIKQVNILNEIDQLNSQLDTMQKEMDTLRILSTTNSPYTEGISSPSSSSSTTSPSQSTLSSLSSVSTVSSPSEPSLTLSQITSDQYSKVIKRQRTQYGLEAIVEQQQLHHQQQQQKQLLQQNNDSSSKTDYSWKLTVSKGNFVIHTDIKTHAELLDYLCKSVTALEMNEFVPYSINDIKPRNMLLSKMIQIFVWKRYGKSRFKSILSGKPNNIKPITLMIENEGTYNTGENNNSYNANNDNHNEYIEFTIQQFLQQLQVQVQHESINSITLKLLHGYFQCQHLNHLAIHVPTFLQLFVKDQVMESPVVLALCAVACSTPCHHIHHILQNQNIVIYSYYYFNRTRDLMADMFDHLDLESFATYVLLAFHKSLLFQFESAQFYADMAERLLNLLDDTFNEDGTSKEEKIEKGYYASEKVLFDRLKVQLSRIVAVIEITKHQKKISYKDHFRSKNQTHQLPKSGTYNTLNRQLLNIFHGISNYLKPALGDSEQEKRHIILSGYVSNLSRECHDAAHHAPSNDTANYVGIIGHILEMSMRRWYASLPDSFRLNIPIFDEFDDTDHNNNNNNKSKWLLALDQIIDVIPLLSTITVYNEYLMMTIAHLSKGPDDIKTRTCIAEYWDKARLEMNNEYIREQWGEKWVHRLEKMDHIYEHKIKPQYSQYQKDNSDNDDGDNTSDHKEAMHVDGNIGKKAKMDENLKIIASVLISGYADFDDPVAVLSVTVANNTLLLLQYVKLHYPCYFDIRIALNVCRVLIRASRFNYGDKAMKLKMQANMICCLSMIREEFDRSPIYASVNEAICKIEKEYDDVLRMNMFE